LSKHKTSLKKNLTDPPSGLGVSFWRNWPDLAGLIKSNEWIGDCCFEIQRWTDFEWYGKMWSG
jgi:hypothetical protein